MNKDTVNTYISYTAILGIVVKALQVILCIMENPGFITPTITYHILMICPFVILFYASRKKYSSVCLMGIIIAVATIVSFNIFDVIYATILIIVSLLLLPSREIYRDSYKKNRFKNIWLLILFIVFALTIPINLYEIESDKFSNLTPKVIVDNFDVSRNRIAKECEIYIRKNNIFPIYDDTGKINFDELGIIEPTIFKGQGKWVYSGKINGKVEFVLFNDSYLAKKGYKSLFSTQTN